MIEPPNIDELMPLLARARDEDLGGGDITSEAVIPAGTQAVGTILAKEPGVLCGAVLLAPLAALYSEIPSPRPSPGGGGGTSGPALRVELDMKDGDALLAGQDRRTAGHGSRVQIVGRVIGPARAILAFERVALNFLQRLSGIASATRAYVDATAGTAAKILDTRKTTPGYRMLEKYAVRCGGGENHRVGLFDAILVKDNHIALGHQNDLPALARQLRRAHPDKLIEIEVDTLEQLRSLLAAADAVDMVLLDNMAVEQLAEAVRLRNELGKPVERRGETLPYGRVSAGDLLWAAGASIRPLLEASGGITLATVRAVAQTGVERISVGAITHSAKALDLSLEIEAVT
jgi:nicotinate-nucleotide pyrophosphorylase (carboxylating)